MSMKTKKQIILSIILKQYNFCKNQELINLSWEGNMKTLRK